jgi:hypothetical protein
MTLKYALAALAILLYVMSCIWFCERVQPYERPPARTQEEQVAVDRAVREVGNYTVVDCEQGIYLDLGQGRKRWAVRRS